MDIFKLFGRITLDIPRQQNDLTECDNICQLLVILSKLIADLKNDETLLSSLNNDEEEELIKLEVNIENLTFIIPNAFEIIDYFDFRSVKFSGYRSYFNIIKKCIQNINLSLQKTLQYNNAKQMDSQWYLYSKCLFQLTIVSKCLLQMMMSRKESKCLYLKKSDDELVYLKIIDSFDTFVSEPFYGPCLGFYLCESCQLMAKFLCSLQLGLGHAMSVPKSDFERLVHTVISGTQSLFLEEKRGSQMCGLFKQATVTFCKQFWNLIDHPFLVRWSHLVLPYLKVIKQITLQPIGIHMPTNGNTDTVIKITPPVAHNGFAEVNIRLLSNKFREGMQWGMDTTSKEVTIDPASKCILIHCHGGGFVAQSSQSHDGYLRQWAIDLDCPIVSIDYSHAPENPFPRAHEECFYTYCWVLRNLQQFGCDSDCRVVICGDSAGGNLALGCVVRALQLNIRLPDGIFLAYPASLVDFIPSPARMLGVIDPILPVGVLARCLLAYVGVNEDTLLQSLNKDPSTEIIEIGELVDSDFVPKVPKPSFLDHNSYDNNGVRLFYSKDDVVSPLHLLENADISSDPVMSPMLASDDIFRKFPPVSIVASEFDPLLDDSVELCKKIDNAGGQFVNLHVMADLPHGFLNMSSPVTRECAAANRVCIDEIKMLLAGDHRQ